MSGPALATLAARHGVHTSYTDVHGVTKRAADEVLVALLQALGVPLRGPADVAAVLRDERRAAVRRPLEPVLVHRLAGPEPVTATLPADTDPEHVWLTLELEDGTTRRDTLAHVATRADEDAAIEGFRSVRHAVDLGALAIDPVPPGYHRFSLEGVGPPSSALVLAAPNCPAQRRSSVAFLPLHALRSENDWGTGSYTDLEELGQWVSEQGVGLLGTLPLYPAFLDAAPADPSPYLPVSRLAYNELYIEPTALPELAASPEARRLLDADGFRARLSAVHASRLVEYEEVARLKRQVLEPMARTVSEGRLPDRLHELRQFADAHPELVAYARFRAAREHARVAPPGSEPSATLTDYHLYCQWVAAQQLSSAGAAVGLYADFPIGSHPDGFDPRWSPPSFMSGVQGGAPPDVFFAEGQTWGFQPLHPQRMRNDGYRYLIAALDRAFRHAECLRVDHVMGLERLYMIPEGFSTGQGTYVSYPADELHALVCIGAARRGSSVVGEDLGTVPESVRRRMARDKMLRTWVFQFESTVAEPLPEPPRRALAALGTHDLPTFAAFLSGDDIAERERSGVLSPDAAAAARVERAEWRSRRLGKLGLGPGSDAPSDGLTFAAFEGCVAHFARGPADLMAIDLEDVWGERAAQNHPGTGPGAGNWRRRSARSLEEITRDPAVGAVCRVLDRAGDAA
jgi:4-alpha-glucanotransferase